MHNFILYTVLILKTKLRKGVKKPIVADMSVNGGGGLPPICNQLGFFKEKNKRCKVFSNGKICILMKTFCEI